MTKISIITPVKNGEKTLQKTIDSVLNQNISNIEYIIVDGLSVDNTHKIIKKNKDRISKIIIEKDYNIYDAMNKGIKLASGDLIGIINSDDYYNENVLNIIQSTFEASPIKENVIIFGDMFNKFENTKFISKGNLTKEVFVNGKFQINHPTVFVSKSLYKRIGLFDVKFNSGADREFILRANQNKAKFIKIDKCISTFTYGGFTSKYSTKIILSRTKEEFQIFKKYYSIFFAFKMAFIQFIRMLRNYLLFYIFGNQTFLKLRIKWLKKND